MNRIIIIAFCFIPGFIWPVYLLNSSSAQKSYQITVAAGPQDRRQTVVFFALDLAQAVIHVLIASNPSKQKSPSQGGRARVRLRQLSHPDCVEIWSFAPPPCGSFAFFGR